jgi:hypothetical protein
MLVLVKYLDSEDRTSPWEVLELDEYTAYAEEYHQPLEILGSADAKELLDFICDQMNRGKGSENFWIRTAPTMSVSGRLDYARGFMAAKKARRRV